MARQSSIVTANNLKTLPLVTKVNKLVDSLPRGTSGNIQSLQNGEGIVYNVPFDLRLSSGSGMVPAQIVSGMGNLYVVNIYANGDTQAATQLNALARIPGLALTESIPALTWIMVSL